MKSSAAKINRTYNGTYVARIVENLKTKESSDHMMRKRMSLLLRIQLAVMVLITTQMA